MLYLVIYYSILYSMEKNYCITELKDSTQRSQFLREFATVKSWNLCIQYNSNYENTKILREIIDEFCNLFGVPLKWKTRLVLIFDELNNNAIEHWSIESDMNRCFISLKKRKDWIYIIGYVEDTWNAVDAKDYKQMKILQEQFKNKDFSKHQSIRGRGLFLIISQLVQVLDFRPASIWWVQVYFEKLIPLE